MRRERNWPDAAWHFDFEVPVSLSDRYRDLISIAGTVALDTKGAMRAPGNLDTQLEMVMDEVEIIVTGARAELDSVAKLVGFYVGEGDADERVRRAIERRFAGPVRPVITAIPVSNLAFPGMMLEVEGFALADDGGAPLPRESVRPGTLRCGDYLFVEGRHAPVDVGASLAEQATAAIDHLREALRDNQLHPEDVVRLNVYYASPNPDADPDADLLTVGDACATGFDAPGPVVTFVPLPRLGDRRRVEIDAIAMSDDLPRQDLTLEAHWRWPSDWPFVQALKRGNAIFIGGQPAFDRERQILLAGDMPGQTRLVMDRIVEILNAFGATYDDMMKVGCWYNGGASIDALKSNALVRTSYVTAPGGTSTGVPVETRYHPDLEIQVDIVAMTESA